MMPVEYIELGGIICVILGIVVAIVEGAIFEKELLND